MQGCLPMCLCVYEHRESCLKLYTQLIFVTLKVEVEDFYLYKLIYSWTLLEQAQY